MAERHHPHTNLPPTIYPHSLPMLQPTSINHLNQINPPSNPPSPYPILPKNGKLSVYTPLTLEILKQLPKAELHCHLDGSVRPQTVLELALEQDLPLPSYDINQLKKLLSVDNDCESLVEYLRCFEITISVLQQAYSLTRCMYEVCEDAVKDGVTYIEIRFAPSLHTKYLSLSAVMTAIIEGKVMAETRLPITVRVIVIAIRSLDNTNTLSAAEIAWRFRSEGVVAFDLAGPEKGFSAADHKEAFDLVRSQMINATIHAGEADSWKSVAEAIRYCGASRIGHGVSLRDNDDLLQSVINHEVAIEVCLTSNVQTKAIKNFESHPIRDFFDKGAIVVPCTDNPIVSSTTLSNEYLLLQNHFKFNVIEILRLIDHGFRAAFLEPIVKKRLRADAYHHSLQILFQSGYDISAFEQELYFIPVSVSLNPKRFPCYWENKIDPPLTPQLFDNIPKSDLHTRLCGSQSNLSLWNALQIVIQDDSPDTSQGLDLLLPKYSTRIESILGVKITNLDDFYSLLSCDDENKSKKCRKHLDAHTTKSDRIVRNLKTPIRRLLSFLTIQTKELIENAVRDVMLSASRDNVRYFEMVIRPTQHTKGLPRFPWLNQHTPLTYEQVLKIVLDMKFQVEQELYVQHDVILHCGIVVGCHQKYDDPIRCFEMAKLAVKYRNYSASNLKLVRPKKTSSDPDGPFLSTLGVVGFSCYGASISTENYIYFKSVFGFLKDHNMNVCINANDPDDIIAAIQLGGARRISSAANAHKSPKLTEYLAQRQIGVEQGLTKKMEQLTIDTLHFAGNPIQLYCDLNIFVSLCSFRAHDAQLSRTAVLRHYATTCKLNIAQILQLVRNGFSTSFAPYPLRIALFKFFWRNQRKLLSSLGFTHLNKKTYFPPKESWLYSPTCSIPAMFPNKVLPTLLPRTTLPVTVSSPNLSIIGIENKEELPKTAP